MSDLTKVPHVLDSREVAKMVGMRHADLMRNISHYVDVISTNAKLRSLDFFIERDYRQEGRKPKALRHHEERLRDGSQQTDRREGHPLHS